MTGVSKSKPWTTNFDTVSQMLSAAASKHPDRTYCKTNDISLSYDQAAHAVDGVAHSLGPQIQGRTVALVLPNSAAFLIAYFGVLAAGAHPALVNYGHPEATVVKLLEEIDVGAVLSDRDIPGLVVTRFDDTNVMELKNADEVLEGFQPTPASGTAATMFSGGTTGLPKQVDRTALRARANEAKR